MANIRVGNKRVLVDDDIAPLLKRHQLSMNGNGYCYIKIDPKHKIGLHRFIIGYVPNEYVVDHINQDRLDNRFCNLRLATKAENAQNVRRPSSGYIGVRRRTHGWFFDISANSDYYKVGYYDTAEDAAVARDSACKFLHGEFAVLNFPDRATAPLDPESLKAERKLNGKTTQDKHNARRKATLEAAGAKIGVKVDKRNGNFIACGPTKLKTGGAVGYIGTFQTEIEAREAYDSVSRYLFGESAPLNFPNRQIEPKSIEELRKICLSRSKPKKYTGVCKAQKDRQFYANLYPGYETVYLGMYEDQEEAAIVRDAAYLHLNPDAPRYKLNFPDMYTVACPPEIIRAYASSDKR